jgi:hypothetical protein
MAKKRKNPVEELWRRITEDYDFQKRMSDFRERNGIPAGGFADVYDIYNTRTPNDTSVITAIQAFVRTMLVEYELVDYLEELEPPMMLYVALNEVEQLTNPSHLTESFGISVADGADVVKAIERVAEYDKYNEPDPKVRELNTQILIKELGLVHSLKKSSILIIKPHASLQDLQNFHKHHSAWLEITDIRDRKDQNVNGSRIRERAKADLHKLVYKAYHEKVIKSDGFRTEAYKGAWPPQYFALALLTSDNIKKILDRERKRRTPKKKKEGE